MNILNGVRLLATAILALVSTPLTVLAADNASQKLTSLPQVCLYYEDNFKGKEVCSYKTIMPLLGPFNDKFASFKVKNGAKLILCTEQIFKKACKVFDKDTTKIEADFYKNTRSLQIFNTRPTNDFVCMFTQQNYAGRRICHPHGDNIDLAGNWLKSIRSIMLFGKGQVKICTDLGLSGTCGTVVKSRKTLPKEFDSLIKSFSVKQAN